MKLSTRRLMRSWRLRGEVRGQRRTRFLAQGCSCWVWRSLIGRPVSSITSRARTILRRSWGWRRAPQRGPGRPAGCGARVRRARWASRSSRMPELAIGRRSGEQAAQESLQIEGRATDEQDSLAALLRPACRGRRPVAIRGDTGRLPGIDDVDQVVRDSRPRGESRLGRGDVHPSIQRHRVERKHLGIQPTRQRHTNFRLARSRRTGQINRAMKDVVRHRPIHSENGLLFSDSHVAMRAGIRGTEVCEIDVVADLARR